MQDAAGRAFVAWQNRLGLTNTRLCAALKALDRRKVGITPRTASNLRSGLRPSVRVQRLLEKLADSRGEEIQPILRRMRSHE